MRGRFRACGAKSALRVAPARRDAGMSDGGVDAGPPATPDAGPPPICPMEPCDCDLAGHMVWNDVGLCAYLPPPYSLGPCGSGWADTVELQASCAGLYTVCARVESLEGCVVGEGCGSRNSAGGRPVHIHVSSFPGGDSECAARAMRQYGARICVRVEWEGYGRAERELGCFAYSGPWCIDPGCPGGGHGPPPDGDDGEWDF